jgi:hypothetical protein
LLARFSLGLHIGREALALLEGCDRRLSMCHDCTAGCPRIIFVILAVKVLERGLDALVDLLEEVLELGRSQSARFGVDRFALTAVDGDDCPRKEIQLLAQHRERMADLPNGFQVVLPKGCSQSALSP